MKTAVSRKGKKICAFIIAVVLTVFSVVPAYAATVKFTDITAHWARPYIEKLTAAKITTGVEVKNGVGKYAPESPVKRVEVIAMLVRLLGLEEEARTMVLPAKFPQASTVPIWAKGYVAMAVEKGIIPADEDFRAEEPALREDVAIFAVRAMGFGNEAESRTTINTKTLAFTDAHLIGLKARPYVEVAIEKGIMAGIGGNKFDPKGKFTRAQMAKLIDNMLQYKPLRNQVVGEVESVDTLLLKTVTIKLSNGTYKTYSVDNDAGIYKRAANNNLEKITLAQIKAGDKVCVLPDDNSTLTYYVEVLNLNSNVSPLTGDNQIKGVIKDVSSVFRSITVTKSDGRDEAITLPVEANIYIENQLASFRDLSLGQPVTLTLSGTNVVRVDAQKVEKTKTVKGIIRAIMTTVISVENDDTGLTESFNIVTGTLVLRNNKNAVLKDLVVGDVVEITVAGSTVTKIDAQKATGEVEGYISNINLAPRYPIITIETSKGRTSDYEFSKNVSIRKNSDRYAEAEDLKKGDEVTLQLEYDKVVSIVATSVRTNVTGTIKSITFDEETTRVVLIDDEGEQYSFFITRDTDLREGRRRFAADELRVGYYLEVDMENEEALSVQVTIKEELLTFQGTIKTINTRREILILEEGKETRDVYYNSDTIFTKGKESITIRKIVEGDRVIVVGEYIEGVFEASSISVLTLN